MMLVVLDTNVLAACAVSRNPAAATVQLIDAWRAGAFTLVLSEPILAELARTFSQPYFQSRLSLTQERAFLTLLRTEAVVVPLTAEVSGVATHPEDDVIVATAVSAGAPYLVTGDAPLRSRESYEGVTFLTPREFLDLLQREGEGSA